jgi:hypothetical protein
MDELPIKKCETCRFFVPYHYQNNKCSETGMCARLDDLPVKHGFDKNCCCDYWEKCLLATRMNNN